MQRYEIKKCETSLFKGCFAIILFGKFWERFRKTLGVVSENFVENCKISDDL